MANSYLKRLMTKIGDIFRGKQSFKEVNDHASIQDQSILGHILSKNSKKIQSEYVQMQNEKMKKVSPKDIRLPSTFSVVDNKIIQDSYEKGKSITRTLKKKLKDDLKNVLSEQILVSRGKSTGALKQDVIKSFEKQIVQTFEGYTKRDKKVGVPPNIHNIAVTEVRTATNKLKHTYVEKLQQENPDRIISTKTWKHNTSLVKVPRPHHLAMNGKTINYNEKFVLQSENGTFYCDHPHADNLPASEVIGCQCEVIYRMKETDNG